MIRSATRSRLDPITVEVIGAAFSSIVEEMGEALIRASYSTNIKERRDCSTALFDAAGARSPGRAHPDAPRQLHRHRPEILRRHPVEALRPGDVFIGNDAYDGRRHAPAGHRARRADLRRRRLVAWTVNLAHHADFVDRGHAHIYQEGLRIPPVRLYRGGELQKDVHGADPAELPGAARAALGDLRAQMAANRLGVQRYAGALRPVRRRHGAGGRRGAAGLRRAQDARRHRRPFPDGV